MLEIKITVSCPDLVQAAATLANALGAKTQPRASAASTSAPAELAPTPVTTAAPGNAPPVNPAPSPVPVTTALSAPPVAPAVPVAAAPTYNLDQISCAGASLIDAGKMDALLALLAKYGVVAVTQLRPEQYGAFATELRALGAQI